MIGDSISHYRVLAKVGEGGMGVVYKAHDTRLDRTVALKFLPAESVASPERVARFRREARAAAALDHPNICTVYEIDEADGRPFIAMAFVAGDSLAEHLARRRLAVTEAIEIATQAAEGLEAAHRAGVVHRDVKPANLLLTEEGSVRIADFGLAKLVDRTAVTREGATLGTVAYMSPEQARGETADARSDVWSLGAVLYEMLTGRRAFAADHESAVLYSILHREPPAASAVRPDVPPELDRILDRALAKDPEARYGSMAALLADLRRLRETTADAPTEAWSGTAPAARRPAWRRPALAALAGVALLAAISVVALRLSSPSGVPEVGRLPIAVVDFVNETGEQELDGLSGMLITALEQSRHLSVLTRSRMFDLLRQLGREQIPRIDEAAGREVCRLAGVDLLAVGTARRFGSTYSLDLKVLDRDSQRHVVTADARGDGQASVPGLIDELAEQIRRALRERGSEIEASSREVGTVTTRDLEAYEQYFRGEEQLDRFDVEAAIERFRAALELDPEFGLAHYRLGYALHLVGRNDEAERSLSAALERLDRMPEKERYMARAYATHLGHSDADLERGLAILREMEQLYVDDKEMIFFIGDWSYHRRRYEVSLTYLERTLAMDPFFRRALLHLALLFRDTGNYERMLEVAQRTKALGRDATSCYLLGSAHGRLGRLEPAVRHLEEAAAFSAFPEIFHEWARAELLFGDPEGAESAARRALEVAPDDPWSHYVLVEVLLRRARAAEAAEIARRLAEGDAGFHGWNLRARVLEAAGRDLDEAARLARRALEAKPPQYEELARRKVFFPLPEETLGRTLLAAGEPEEAVVYLRHALELAPLREEIAQSLLRAEAALERTAGGEPLRSGQST